MRRRLMSDNVNEIIEYFEGKALPGDYMAITYTNKGETFNEYVLCDSTGFFSLEVPQSVTSFSIDDMYKHMLYEVTQMPSLQNCTSFDGLFNECEHLNFVNLDNLITNQCTSMRFMFRNCNSLIRVDLSKFDTSNVTDFDSMFAYCHNLTPLDVTNFNTSKAITLRNMFCYCTNLKTLDVSIFDTRNVTDFYAVFSHCTNLTSLNITGWNIQKANDFSFMFWYLENITSITGLDSVLNCQTPYLTNMQFMFCACRKLQVIKPFFTTENVTNAQNMFQNCESITTLDVSTFNTQNCQKMNTMFSDCIKLQEIKGINMFNTSKVELMNTMFSGCKLLSSLDVSNFNTISCTNMTAMFYDCESLTSLDVSNFDTSNVTLFTNMFSYCTNLKLLNVSNFNTKKATEISNMFYNCENVEEINLGKDFTCENVENFTGLFGLCSNLPTIDISMINFSKATTISSLFLICKKLSSVVFPKTCTYKNLTVIDSIFDQCYEITSIDMSALNPTYLTNIKHAFLGCGMLKTLDISNLNLTNTITEMAHSFNCNFTEVKCTCESKHWILEHADDVNLRDEYNNSCNSVYPDCDDCDEKEKPIANLFCLNIINNFAPTVISSPLGWYNASIQSNAIVNYDLNYNENIYYLYGIYNNDALINFEIWDRTKVIDCNLSITLYKAIENRTPTAINDEFIKQEEINYENYFSVEKILHTNNIGNGAGSEFIIKFKDLLPWEDIENIPIIWADVRLISKPTFDTYFCVYNSYKPEILNTNVSNLIWSTTDYSSKIDFFNGMDKGIPYKDTEYQNYVYQIDGISKYKLSFTSTNEPRVKFAFQGYDFYLSNSNDNVKLYLYVTHTNSDSVEQLKFGEQTNYINLKDFYNMNTELIVTGYNSLT